MTKRARAVAPSVRLGWLDVAGSDAASPFVFASRAVQTQPTVRATSDDGAVVVILPIVLPPTLPPDPKPAALAQGRMAAAWAGVGRPGVRRYDVAHGVAPALPIFALHAGIVDRRRSASTPHHRLIVGLPSGR